MSGMKKFVSYFITSIPDEACLTSAGKQLQQDIAEDYHISQCFFYGDAVEIATLNEYSPAAEKFIDLVESQQIPLHICGAAMQKRHFHISQLGQQDFTPKGLGQFIEESKTAEKIQQF